MARHEGRVEDQAGLGLGGVFTGLGNLIKLLSDMEAEGKTAVSRVGELRGTGAAKDVKGVYGFSVKIGLGGEPTIETFGNIRKGEAGPMVEEVREPLVDVFDEGPSIRVLAEMPGVEAADVRVELNDDVLIISAEGKDRKYSKEILLPAKGRRDSVRTSYKNGILEVTAAKAEVQP